MEVVEALLQGAMIGSVVIFGVVVVAGLTWFSWAIHCDRRDSREEIDEFIEKNLGTLSYDQWDGVTFHYHSGLTVTNIWGAGKAAKQYIEKTGRGHLLEYRPLPTDPEFEEKLEGAR